MLRDIRHPTTRTSRRHGALFPNPNKDSLILQIRNARHQHYRTTIFNATGQRIQTLYLTGNNPTFPINHLARGRYYYQIENIRDHTPIGQGTFIIQQ